MTTHRLMTVRGTEGKIINKTVASHGIISYIGISDKEKNNEYITKKSD